MIPSINLETEFEIFNKIYIKLINALNKELLHLSNFRLLSFPFLEIDLHHAFNN